MTEIIQLVPVFFADAFFGFFIATWFLALYLAFKLKIKLGLCMLKEERTRTRILLTSCIVYLMVIGASLIHALYNFLAHWS